MNPGARIAIHGGCGRLAREGLGEDREHAVRAALEDIALEIFDLLCRGAGAVDAVERAVILLEECEFFNAGRGSVLNAEGNVEMDAAVMDGATGRAGAVGAVAGVRNPVSLARAVMDHTGHVLLVGDGARRLARERGLALAEDAHLVTEARRRELQRARGAGRVSLDHDECYGTVGAVARDARGHLAAATSTGGMTNKLVGRVGDSALIGAGTWASDQTCAVSATGFGEPCMRTSLAHGVHARMQFAGMTLEAACREALAAARGLGGAGGLIAVDRDGNLALPFDTPGMYRAWAGADGRLRAAIFPSDGRGSGAT